MVVLVVVVHPKQMTIHVMILNPPEETAENALSCRKMPFLSGNFFRGAQHRKWQEITGWFQDSRIPSKLKSCFCNRALVKAICEALKCLWIECFWGLKLGLDQNPITKARSPPSRESRTPANFHERWRQAALTQDHCPRMAYTSQRQKAWRVLLKEVAELVCSSQETFKAQPTWRQTLTHTHTKCIYWSPP